MLERQLVTKLLKRLRAIPNSWWYKIPDPTTCPKCGSIAVTEKKPFDIVGVANDRGIAIEVKRAGFNVDKLPPHQKAHLTRFALSGFSYVIVGENEFWEIKPDGRLIESSYFDHLI